LLTFSLSDVCDVFFDKKLFCGKRTVGTLNDLTYLPFC